jgi:hypothetical protein
MKACLIEDVANGEGRDCRAGRYLGGCAGNVIHFSALIARDAAGTRVLTGDGS